MPELKLSKLPDRTPVKITITVAPDLNVALSQYAQAYRAVYGEAESIAELIPYMLEAFLAGDRGFAKARKESFPEGAPAPPRRPRGRRPSAQPSPPSTPPQEE
ncbi:MAG: DUF2274 domain-containing protein [Alphaproteobacteria bacterium]|nr:DUF2274 domain-containing protein [Alphaproteobacteria bacterium]